jgi:hypothetical protein
MEYFQMNLNNEVSMFRTPDAKRRKKPAEAIVLSDQLMTGNPDLPHRECDAGVGAYQTISLTRVGQSGSAPFPPQLLRETVQFMSIF